MKEINFMIIIIMLFCTASNVLFAQRPGEPWMETLNQEFQNCEVHSTPLGAWEAAGSNAVIDTVFTINVAAFPDSVTFVDPDTGDLVPIPHAQSGDGFDNSPIINGLIEWLQDRPWLQNTHAQIYIPPGVYNFSDQIVMHSNISLKGAGSDQTELRFLIKSDSTMTQADCQKDAIQINGSSFTLEHMIHNVGIEDLKIVRMRDELPEHIIWAYIKKRVDDKYPGNNIAIRFANNCWVKGVESENTFRNHVTMEFADHVTISGVYFHLANKYLDCGVGYGVGLWDSWNCRIENSIFDHLRHGITVSDGSKFNVLSYNFFRDQHSMELSEKFQDYIPWELPSEINTSPRGDIAIHGEATNHHFNVQHHPDYTYDPGRRPMYNLIEGNCLESMEVDGTHEYNGKYNTFFRNRVKGQIHVHGRDGYLNSILDWVLLAYSALQMPPNIYIVTYLSGRTCVDCLSLRFTENDYFKNQPRQLFVNNYARERNWWKSQIQDYPVRMHSHTSQYHANTLKDYASWWGGTKQRTIGRDSDFYNVESLCFFETHTHTRPDFWPDTITWPYKYKTVENPAQKRWNLGSKYTMGPDDNPNLLSVTYIKADTLLVDDLVINSGCMKVIEPGVTISVKNGKKIVVNGTLIAEGTEAEPITFTSSDPDKTWRGIEVKQKDNKPLPSITLSNCIISRANKRALNLESYSEAHIDSCSFINNQDHGAISSEDGSLYLSNSLFMDNTIFSNSQKNGTALYLKNTDAQISNTIFTDNVSNRSATGTVHVKHKDGDESRKTEFFNCYFSNNIFGVNTANENIGLAIHSENYEGILGIYNCSFIDQPQEIFSSLKNDVIITNSLFWNSACDPHFIKSNQTNPLFSFMISKSFIPDYTQSPNINHYTVLDTVYVGNAMLQLDTETNLYSHGVLSPLVNSASNDVQWLESYVATDLLGNPRYCGSGIDIGAIELMKPEVSVVDSLLDFGDVHVFEEGILIYRVENTGTEDLVLDYPLFPEGYSTDVRFPCTIPTAYSGSTAPIDIDDDEDEDDDEEALYTNPFVYIPIKFSPLSHTLDYADKCITFATNDSLCQLIEICVTGKGVAAELSMSADFIHMSDFPANNTPSFGREFLVFKNTGNIGLIIDSLYVQHSENGFAIFQYTTTTETENKYKHVDIRQPQDRPSNIKARAKATTNQLHDFSSIQRSEGKDRKRDNTELPKNLTWHGTGYNHQFQLAPGDSVFFHTRYQPFLIGADFSRVNIKCNDAYNPEQMITLSGEGIPLVVTDNPSEIQVSNVISADTLWSCPQIEIQANVEIDSQARLTIRPHKDTISVKADSNSGFIVLGELQARRSLNQIFGISFAGIDSLASWKGFVFKDNPFGESRLDSLLIVNTNDYDRLENGGGAIHISGYHHLALNSVEIKNSSSAMNGGAILLEQTEVQVFDCSITDSNAQNGGAIAVVGNDATLRITGSSLIDNEAVESGGSLYIDQAQVFITELQIAGSYASVGGGISASGTNSYLSINESLFTGNTSENYGGAIHLDSGKLGVLGSSFVQNISEHGGAIAVFGDQSNVTISQGIFNENGDLAEASSYSCNGGAIYHAGGELIISGGTHFAQNRGHTGGAISITDDTASLSVNNALFYLNMASVQGGAVSSVAGTLKIENSSFDGCFAPVYGGAIAIFDTDYSLSRSLFTGCLSDINNGKGGSVFIDNSNKLPGKGLGGKTNPINLLQANEIKNSQAFKGGAIYQHGTGDIVSNAIVQNLASQGGGFYLKHNTGRFENNTIADNEAISFGGAIVCDSLRMEIKNTIIWGNEQANGNPVYCIGVQNIDFFNCATEDAYQLSSGVLLSSSIQDCLSEDPVFDLNSQYPYQLYKTSLCVNAGTEGSNLDDMDVLGNPRINTNNGTPIIDIGAYEFMGAYWVCTQDTISGYVKITYSPTHFINDLEVKNESTLHIDPGISFLAANNSMIKVFGSMKAQGNEPSPINFSTAPGNNSWYGFSFEGGQSAGSSIFKYCSFSNGKAFPDATHTEPIASNGGMMYIDGYSDITIDHCSFDNNQARDNGGAIYITTIPVQDTLVISNSSFVSNRVKQSTGGAICAIDCNLNVNGNAFSLNSANYPLDLSVLADAYGFSGGAISLISTGSVDIAYTVVGNQFHANSAAGSGGSIFANCGTQQINSNQFYDSIALGANKPGIIECNYGGGAISLHNNAIAEIGQNSFVSNKAHAGGAILNSGSTCKVSDNTFTGNKAKYGGAIQLIDLHSQNILTKNVFETNGTVDTTSCFIGGGIRLSDSASRTLISLNKFSGNSCTSMGGAIAIQASDSTIVVNNQIDHNTSMFGGGVYLECADLEFNNNTIVHNEGSAAGGGIYVNNSTLESTNNLHWANSSPNGFEAYLTDNASMPAQYCFISQIPNAIACLNGATATLYGCLGETGVSPQLINNIYNYNLKHDSPCVNRGAHQVYCTEIDLNARNRIVGGRIDIGAYEYSGTVIDSSPGDTLTIWNDTCISVVAPITISQGQKLLIKDNVTVFFEPYGALIVQDAELEILNNVSFVSETAGASYQIVLKEAMPLVLNNITAFGVKMKSEGTFLNILGSTFANSHLTHRNQSLNILDTEFASSNLDLLNTLVTNDTLGVFIIDSYFHDQADSTAIRIYSYPNYRINNNVISNYYNGLSLFESGHGNTFSLAGNQIQGNQYGYGIQVYHSNLDIESNGDISNNYIGLGALRNSSLSLLGNKEPPYQSINNNYWDELAFTHDSFPKDIKFNLIYDSIHPSDVLIRCSGCNAPEIHDLSYNYWSIVEPDKYFFPEGKYSHLPVWEMDLAFVPDISADYDLFTLAKYNLKIGHNDLAAIHFRDLISNYPDTKYKEEAAKLLMAAEATCSDKIYDLKHFYATEPNLHNEMGIEILSHYLINYCNLKLEDYPAVIDWYEGIIDNPPSVADSIYAVIDLAYTYLLMNETNTRSQYHGKYLHYKPESLQSFRRQLDQYIDLLLHPIPAELYEPPTPQPFALFQNYPNPFNPSTTIQYSLPKAAKLRLDIYNIKGQLVKTLVNSEMPAGTHSIVWNGRDMKNRAVATGVYFYRISSPKEGSITKKMMLMK